MKKLMFLTITCAALVAVPLLSAQAASKYPKVTWTTTSLRADTTPELPSLATTDSSGGIIWSAKGACSVSGGRLAVGSAGSCSVTMRIAADSGFRARTASRRFTIRKVSVPATYDPYAGSNPGTPAVGSRTEGVVLTPDGRTRHYRIYVPSHLPSGAVPLLVGLHGGLGTSAQFEANSGFDELAESNGFIVAYPDGIGNRPDGTGFQTWNGIYCCGPAQAQDVDDVTFISMLIDLVSQQFNIDATRVFAAGHSNGGILAYRLACELSEKIVAIGVQAGSNVVPGCAPSKPVSALHLHGTSDTNMPINGGKGTGLANTVFVAARSAVDALAAANGCTSAATTATMSSNRDVSALTWSRSGSTVQVQFVQVATATHAWMGHPAQSTLAAAYIGEPYLRFDSSRAIWAFLASHPRT